MDCREIKPLLSEYQEGSLSEALQASVKAHLDGCPLCREELQLFENAWDMLREVPEIEPQPGYVGRFWARVAERESRPQPLTEGLQALWGSLWNVPALAAICVVLVIGLFSIRNVYWLTRADERLARLPLEEAEIVENIELAQHIEVIENIDLLEDFEIIENLDSLKS